MEATNGGCPTSLPSISASDGSSTRRSRRSSPVGFSNYLPQNNTLVLGGVGHIPENLGVHTVYHYFAPRIGAAYRLSDKTVIRGGIGISYTSFPDNTYAYNFPVRSNNEYLSSGGTYQNSTPVIYPQRPGGDLAGRRSRAAAGGRAL